MGNHDNVKILEVYEVTVLLPEIVDIRYRQHSIIPYFVDGFACERFQTQFTNRSISATGNSAGVLVTEVM